MKHLLSFDDVTYIYHTRRGETVAAEHLSFSLDEGEFAAVIGPSGCGKTTLLSLAAGLLTPSEGKVESGGASFGYMLQKDELFPWRTVEKNLYLPLEIKKMKGDAPRKRVRALAEKYGLGGCLYRAGCGSAPRSSAPSPPTPTCCCSTNPSPRSIIRRG